MMESSTCAPLRYAECPRCGMPHTDACPIRHQDEPAEHRAAACRLVALDLLEGVRAAARADGHAPLESPRYSMWIVYELRRLFDRDDEELVLAVLRDSDTRLRVIEGHAVLAPAGLRGAKLPSRAGAVLLAELVEGYLHIVPTDRAVRRVMTILAERVRRVKGAA